MMRPTPRTKKPCPARGAANPAWLGNGPVLHALVLVCWLGGLIANAQAQKLPNARAQPASPQLAPTRTPASTKRLCQSGDVFQLPDPQATPPLNKPTHGITLTVDTRWNIEAGYYPVRVRVDRVSSSQQDTAITIRFFESESFTGLPSRGYQPGYTVLQDMEIPAGASHATATVSVPHIHQYHADASWEVYVDGSLADELSSGARAFEYLRELPSHPRFLFVRDKFTQAIAQDLLGSENPQKTPAELEEMLSAGGRPYWNRNSNTEFSFLELPIDEFPHRARDYSNLDILYLTWSQFQELREKENVWSAIHQWVATGGNIWITGVDPRDNLPEIDQALGLPSQSGEPPMSGWQTLEQEEEAQLNFRAKEIVENWQSLDTAANQITASNPTPAPARPKPPVPRIPELRWRAVMMGRACVFSAERPFAVQDKLRVKGNSVVRFPYTLLLRSRDCWQHRHGLKLQQGNSGFWNWLIPSVGLPPVTLFQILITLFVIGIGPVNYILLRRARRLYLLLVTVPVAALGIMLGIFAYALLTDGLSTRVRTRSYTEIDQTSGLAVAWARHSYYSGLAPDDGMNFSNETIIYPIRPEDHNYRHVMEDQGAFEIQWGSRQYLSGDWLPSRVPKQYLTVRSTQTKAQLQVRQAAGKLQVRNDLTTPLKQLLVMGTDGKFYWGEQIAVGANATLSEVPLVSAVSKLNGSLSAESLRYPEALASMNRYPAVGTGTTGFGAGLKDWISIETSLLEESFRRVKRGNPNEADSRYAPGRYLAITESLPLGTCGVAEAVEQGSVHVVSGRWK